MVYHKKELGDKELLKLIGEFHRLTPENKRFLEIRYAPSANTLNEFKRKIDDALYPDVLRSTSGRRKRRYQPIQKQAATS